MKCIMQYPVITISIFCLLLTPSIAKAQSNKVSICKLLSSDPVLDGKVLQDPVWKTVPENDGFVKLRTKTPGKRQTRFKMGYTINGIYLGVICEEPNINNLVTNKKDMEMVWKDDSIQIWIAPDKMGKANNFHFVTNAVGVRYNLAYKNMDMGIPEKTDLWNWKVATYKGKDYWSVEIRIPFSIFRAFPKKEGEEWRFNIGRDSHAVKNETSSWSPVAFRLHEPLSFGKMIFKGYFNEADNKNAKQKMDCWHKQNLIKLIRNSWQTNHICRSSDPLYKRFLSTQSAKYIKYLGNQISSLKSKSLYEVIELEKKVSGFNNKFIRYEKDEEFLLRKKIMNGFVPVEKTKY